MHERSWPPGLVVRLVLRFSVACVIAFSGIAVRCAGADPIDPGMSPADLRPSPSAAQERRADQRRPQQFAAISLRSAPWGTPAAHPLRQIKLINGDSFTVEVLSSTLGALDVRWLGQIRFRIPLAAIEQIVSLPGERDLLSEHFGEKLSRLGDQATTCRTAHGMLVVSADSGICPLDLPSYQGDYRLALRFRVPREAAKKMVRWTIPFADQQPLRILRDSHGVWRVEDSFTEISQRQSVPDQPGWHTLRLQRTAGRLSVSLDEATLVSGRSPAAAPAGCRIETSGSPVFVDQLTLAARNQPPVDLPLKYAADAVVGSGGETWWGDMQSLGTDEVVWGDADQTWHRPWSELHGVLFREKSNAVVASKLMGTIISLRLQPLSDRPDLPGDRLTAGLGAGRNGFVELHHPLLGRLMVPLRAIQRVEHRGTGSSQVLDARESSLGQPSAHPNTAPLEGQFVLDDVPTSGIGFVAEFSGLEPSGPDTPPGSRTLNSLRAGRLVTELYVNGRLVGNFNELTSDWSLPGRFDRLRLEVSADDLRRGQNSWRIAQQPGDGPRRPYDECQIRNIAWESP